MRWPDEDSARRRATWASVRATHFVLLAVNSVTLCAANVLVGVPVGMFPSEA